MAEPIPLVFHGECPGDDKEGAAKFGAKHVVGKEEGKRERGTYDMLC